MKNIISQIDFEKVLRYILLFFWVPLIKGYHCFITYYCRNTKMEQVITGDQTLLGSKSSYAHVISACKEIQHNQPQKALAFSLLVERIFRWFSSLMLQAFLSAITSAFSAPCGAGGASSSYTIHHRVGCRYLFLGFSKD